MVPRRLAWCPWGKSRPRLPGRTGEDGAGWTPRGSSDGPGATGPALPEPRVATGFLCNGIPAAPGLLQGSWARGPSSRTHGPGPPHLAVPRPRRGAGGRNSAVCPPSCARSSRPATRTLETFTSPLCDPLSLAAPSPPSSPPLPSSWSTATEHWGREEGPGGCPASATMTGVPPPGQEPQKEPGHTQTPLRPRAGLGMTRNRSHRRIQKGGC